VILVVSHDADDHAAAVLACLREAGHPAALLDTAHFPTRATLAHALDAGGERRAYDVDGGSVPLDECRAVWWRRPQPHAVDARLPSEAAAFAYTECAEAVSGLWAALDARWVNPPELDGKAHHKPYQLSVARRVGLPIPRTLITNDPAAARAFVAEVGRERTVYKTFLATERCWRETRILRAEEEPRLDAVALAPVIFQEYVPAVCDLRVTAVGDRLFAAAIRPAPGGYDVDYRMDMNGARFEPAELPDAVERDLLELLRRLGLVYGAIDLRRTPDGAYVFLEVNPAGEWLFVEERTGQPIALAMSTLLRELDAELL
jgi:glutathione synthase/RimK-type ligase-like ATP-grasp enzyme